MKELIEYIGICILALVLGYAVLSDGVIKPVSELVGQTAESIRGNR
jgi:hypothetical protein